ncbi:MAG: hypothetical protein KF689_11820 [Gemmatimonadaceae bacterium]|nr:hypothetical protein [Gemmatimonadaceae bacterium]
MLASCEAPTDPNASRVRLEMGTQSIYADAMALLESHDSDSTVIVGHILFPGSPYSASARLQTGPGEWTVVLRAVPLPNCCADVLNTRAYRLRIAGTLPAGTLLRVVHSYPNTGWAADTIFERTLAPIALQRATP